MGARYAVTGNMATVGSSDEYAAEIIGGTAAIVRIYHLLFACDGTPIDEMAVYSIHKLSAGGTADALTAEPLNAFSPVAAKSTSKENHSVSPTTTGIPIIEVPVHLRSTLQWMAPPDGELQSALAAGDGWGYSARAPTYISTSKASILFKE